MSAGASGLGSKLSMWLAPPYWTMKIHDFSRPGRPAEDDSLAQQLRQAEADGPDAADLQQPAAGDPGIGRRHDSPFPWHGNATVP